MKDTSKTTKKRSKTLNDIVTSGGTTSDILHQLAELRRAVLLKRIKSIIKEIEKLEG